MFIKNLKYLAQNEKALAEFKKTYPDVHKAFEDGRPSEAINYL